MLTFGVVAYATGFLVLAYLVYVLLNGMRGDPSLLKVLFAGSAGLFALIAIGSAIAYFHASYGELNYYGTDVLAGFFALAAFGAFRFYQIANKAEAAAKAAAGASDAQVVADLHSKLDALDAGKPRYALTTRVAPNGDLGASVARSFEKQIASACSDETAKVVIDLRKVTSMEPAAVEAILACYRRFGSSRMTIVAPPDSAAYRALELLGVEQLIPIEAAPAK